MKRKNTNSKPLGVVLKIKKKIVDKFIDYNKKIEKILKDLKPNNYSFNKKVDCYFDRFKGNELNNKKFSIFCWSLAIYSYNFPINIEASSFTDRGNDKRLDGVAISIGSHGFIKDDDIEGILQNHPNEKIKLLFMQSIGSENFTNQTITDFGFSIEAFLTQNPETYNQTNQTLQIQHEIFNKIKTYNQNIELDIEFVIPYRGDWNSPENPRLAIEIIEGRLRSKFGSCRGDVWGAKDIVTIYNNAGSYNKCKFTKIQLSKLPNNCKKIENSYQGYIRAKELVYTLSCKESNDFSLDESHFMYNPRTFISGKNLGSESLLKSLRSKYSREQIVHGHNGIIITTTNTFKGFSGGEITVLAPQVVNGRQTSETLIRYLGECNSFEEYEKKLEDVYIPIRIIETKDEFVRDGIIIASNTQSIVDKFDLLSYKPFVKKLEKEINSPVWTSNEYLALQRRAHDINEIHDDDTRFVALRDLMEAYTSSIEDVPHFASNVSKLHEFEKSGIIFSMTHYNHMEIYRVMAYLVVIAKRRSVNNGNTWRGRGSMSDRYQFIYTIWLLISHNKNIDIVDIIRQIFEDMTDILRDTQQVSDLTEKAEGILSLVKITCTDTNSPEFAKAIKNEVDNILKTSAV